MAGLWEIIQEVASVTRHLAELREETTAIRADTQELRREMHARLEGVGERIHVLEREITALQQARETTREAIRAEIAVAVAELRARYAEEQARRNRRGLDEGED